MVWVSAPTAVTTSADLNRLACGGCHGPSDSFCEAPVVALLSRDRRKASSSGAGPSPASAQSLLRPRCRGSPCTSRQRSPARGDARVTISAAARLLACERLVQLVEDADLNICGGSHENNRGMQASPWATLGLSSNGDFHDLKCSRTASVRGVAASRAEAVREGCDEPLVLEESSCVLTILRARMALVFLTGVTMGTTSGRSVTLKYRSLQPASYY